MKGWPRRPVEPVDVLAVCTGDLCRSPMIETLLRASVPSLTVRSAGTAAPHARDWHPLTVQVLAEAGHAVTGRAHRLRRADVRAASLLLTAERAHRVATVELDPSAADRSFTLLEAARLLEVAPAAPGIGAARLAAHLAAALREHPQEHDDDLADPILGELEQFRTCRQQIEAALRPIIPALRVRQVDAG